ncbi:MAG: hypothetical protein OXH09_20815 [Gammaproteobacteria bacterium]|nr:hypothetical protein [Gammaproteobacteria bacterium]
MADRLADTRRFYELLDRLENRVGGTRRLAECNGRMDWPQRGLYFFFEAGEERSGSGEGLRVVRIGTHGLKAGSRSTLWGRLSQHRGTSRGTGNHRGSIFRMLVGIALARQSCIDLPPSWGVGADPGAAARRLGVDRARVNSAEADLEIQVSRYIGDMPFLWLDVGDEPGPASQRGLIERNAIALLSGYGKRAPDPPSTGWLGRFSDRERVRGSGLWNNNHVDERYDSLFLDRLEERINLNGTPN